MDLYVLYLQIISTQGLNFHQDIPDIEEVDSHSQVVPNML